MSILLLDTQAFVWAVSAPDRLSAAARSAVVARTNRVLVSAATIAAPGRTRSGAGRLATFLTADQPPGRPTPPTLDAPSTAPPGRPPATTFPDDGGTVGGAEAALAHRGGPRRTQEQRSADSTTHPPSSLIAIASPV
jgi:hypothetical protein